MNKLLYEWQALPLGPHLSSPLQSYFGCCEVILPGTTYIFKVKMEVYIVDQMLHWKPA